MSKPHARVSTWFYDSTQGDRELVLHVNVTPAGRTLGGPGSVLLVEGVLLAVRALLDARLAGNRTREPVDVTVAADCSMVTLCPDNRPGRDPFVLPDLPVSLEGA